MLTGQIEPSVEMQTIWSLRNLVIGHNALSPWVRQAAVACHWINFVLYMHKN